MLMAKIIRVNRATLLRLRLCDSSPFCIVKRLHDEHHLLCHRAQVLQRKKAAGKHTLIMLYLFDLSTASRALRLWQS